MRTGFLTLHMTRIVVAALGAVLVVASPAAALSPQVPPGMEGQEHEALSVSRAYTVTIPSDRIAGVQSALHAACERIAPRACRITGSVYRANEGGVQEAALDAAISTSVAAGYLNTLTRTVTDAGGTITQVEAVGELSGLPVAWSPLSIRFTPMPVANATVSASTVTAAEAAQASWTAMVSWLVIVAGATLPWLALVAVLALIWRQWKPRAGVSRGVEHGVYEYAAPAIPPLRESNLTLVG